LYSTANKQVVEGGSYHDVMGELECHHDDTKLTLAHPGRSIYDVIELVAFVDGILYAKERLIKHQGVSTKNSLFL
jgi:hypothetical protein